MPSMLNVCIVDFCNCFSFDCDELLDQNHEDNQSMFIKGKKGEVCMGENLSRKIIKNHLLDGKIEPGEEIALKIDQTLTQDATGTMVCLEFEALGLSRVKTELSVSYIDHNTLQVGFENADDHLFLQSFARKYGMYFSRAGNGICHQVHLHRFAVPGKTLLGSDSHTPTCGSLGMLAIGAGGLNVAMAMAGQPFYMKMPEVVSVVLEGKLRPGVSAKDIILEILRCLTVKGGIGMIMEYTGPGVATLSVPERATVTNMGAELGATTSIFPSDERTFEFMKAQGREKGWIELKPDEDAEYDRVIHVNLDELEPMVAMPHSPDNVVKVGDLEGIKVDQVYIGSCTNSSYSDMAKAAAILEGKRVHPDVSLVVAPGSRQVFQMLARDGIIEKFIAAGARIIECACGPCVGVGQSPPSGGVSVRTSNRNFKGRSGTADARVYLASPETAAVAAITGKITDPRPFISNLIEIKEPTKYIVDDGMIILPADDPDRVKIRRGPNIKPLPLRDGLPNRLNKQVLLKVGDNITTDDIMPAGAKILPLRSNIPAISQYVFNGIDPDFPVRAQEAGGGIIVGGENYGQGSSREHAAIAPMYLGVRAVIAKSFARIHHDNLVNFGILPLCFKDKANYDRIKQGDLLEIDNLRESIKKGEVKVFNKTGGFEFNTYLTLSDRASKVMLDGGLLNHVKKQSK